MRHMVGNAGKYLALFLVLVMAAACDDDGPVEMEEDPLAQLEGTWQTASWIYTANADPDVATPNLVTAGFGFEVTVDGEGNYTGTITLPTENIVDGPLAGTITINGDQLTITDQNFGPILNQTFTFELSGNTLTLTNTDSSFDFNTDGTEIPATLELVLNRVATG